MQPVTTPDHSHCSADGEARLVNREEFIALLLSRKPLIREDDARTFTFVLRDYISGTRYLLPERLMRR